MNLLPWWNQYCLHFDIRNRQVAVETSRLRYDDVVEMILPQSVRLLASVAVVVAFD